MPSVVAKEEQCSNNQNDEGSSSNHDSDSSPYWSEGASMSDSEAHADHDHDHGSDTDSILTTKKYKQPISISATNVGIGSWVSQINLLLFEYLINFLLKEH